MLKTIFFDFFLANPKKVVLLQRKTSKGALAQLARALAWHARGHRFDSVMLHKTTRWNQRVFYFSVLLNFDHVWSTTDMMMSAMPSINEKFNSWYSLKISMARIML